MASWKRPGNNGRVADSKPREVQEALPPTLTAGDRSRVFSLYRARNLNFRIAFLFVISSLESARYFGGSEIARHGRSHYKQGLAVGARPSVPSYAAPGQPHAGQPKHELGAMESAYLALVQSTIHSALSGVVLGNGISIRQSEVIDRYGRVCTVEEFRALPRNEITDDWERIPDEELERACIAHLDQKVFATTSQPSRSASFAIMIVRQFGSSEPFPASIQKKSRIGPTVCEDMTC
jgi:hypothetical protein